MEKTIEAAFFKAFEFGGFVDSCIDYVQRKYDWGFKYSPDSKQRHLHKKWEQFYFVELPKTIKAGFDAFDSRVIETPHSPLIDEIEQNLQNCPNDIERDKYIFSLITPFERLSGIINPIAEIDRLKARISDDEKAIEFWSKENLDEQLKTTAGKAAGTPREQIEACKAEIDRLTWQVERTKEIGHNFILLLCSSQINELWTEEGTVEYYLSAMLGTMEMYSNRLFAMLIQHGINLKEYQRKAGVYLKRNWNITDIACYVGSMELAKYYLDKLPMAMLNDEQITGAMQQTDQHNTSGKRGRPTKPFKDLMLNDEQGEHLLKMHRVLSGKKGKDFVLIIVACMKIGWITKPTYTQAKNEFGDIGSKQIYSKYLSNQYAFTQTEIEGAINSLN